MELNKLNDVSIYLIPLIDDNITLSDVSEESGFINAYTEDKNRPYLTDKVFLLYDSSINTEQALNRFIKFDKLETLYNKSFIKIKNKSYTIYCFTLVSYKKDIKNLIQFGKVYSAKARIEILQFWRGHETLDMIRRLSINTYRCDEPISAISPEEDYYDDLILS